MKTIIHAILISLVNILFGYTVNAQQNQNTSATSAIEKKSVSPYKETNELGLQLFPNPCTNEFSVLFENPHPDQAEVQLMDVNYEVISHRTHDISYKGTVSFNFDVSALPSGIYFVHVATREGMSTLKFMKQ